MPAFHNVIVARLERDVLLQQIRDKPKAWFVEKIVIWHGPVKVIDLAHRRLLAADAALGAAVGDDSDVADTQPNRAHRMGPVIFERRTSDDGRAALLRLADKGRKLHTKARLTATGPNSGGGIRCPRMAG